MVGREQDPRGDARADVLSTVGLMLNVGAVICFALWLSTVGGGYRDGSGAVAGIATIVCFGLSFACFAADRSATADAGPDPVGVSAP